MSAGRQDVALRLHAVAIRLLRAVSVEDRRSGMTRARLSALSVLVFAGPRTLTQLTEMEQVAAPTMTKLIAGLERDGYVRRAADARDARRWVIHARPKARRLMQESRARRVALIMDLLRDLPARDWETIADAVTVIEDAMRTR